MRSPAQPPARLAASRAALGARGACALLVSLLCLVAQVGSAAHLALVSHVRCFEHDALVHTQPADHAAAAALASAQAKAQGGGASGVPADAGTHADDHCLAAGMRRREDVSGPAAVRLPDPLPPLVVAHARAPGRLPPPAVALLLLAPKSGPPALAVARA